jgi:hypothetical protein
MPGIRLSIRLGLAIIVNITGGVCRQMVNCDYGFMYGCQGHNDTMTTNEASTAQEPEALEYKGIAFTPQGIAELRGHRVSAVVAWNDVQSLTLRYGFGVKHPFVQIGIGVLLTAVGVFALLCMIGWLPYNYFLSSLLFILLGVWMSLDGMRRRYYLDVELLTGRKRLVFWKVSDPSELLSFLATVQKQFGRTCHVGL